VTYTPDYGFVKQSDYGSKDVEWSLVIYNPRARILTSKVKWTVKGDRQTPTVYFPQKINQGPPTVEFMLHAIDVNGEIPPRVTVDPSPTGAIVLENVGSSPGSSTSKPFQIIYVKWSGIPPEEAGKNVTLYFRSCVNGAYSGDTLCTTTPVPVFLNGGKP